MSNLQQLRRAVLFQNGYVILVLILFLVSALSFFFNPNAVDRSLPNMHPFDYYWHSFYLLGSATALFGLFSQRVGLEAAGHALLVPGLLGNFAFSALVLGLHAATLLTLVFAIGATMRAIGLVRGWSSLNE